MNLLTSALCRSLPSVRRSIFVIMLAASWSSIGADTVCAVESDLSRRPLEHQDYDVWNTISTTSISRDGKWVMYRVSSDKADGETTLVIRSTSSAMQYSVARGAGSRYQ